MCGSIIQYAMRYAALSLGVQPMYSDMVSNCCRNTAHEVHLSNLGVCDTSATVPVLSQEPRLARASVVEYPPNSRAEQTVYNFCYLGLASSPRGIYYGIHCLYLALSSLGPMMEGHQDVFPP
jgi:hypothetical protein